MPSTTLAVRIDDDDKARLDALARSTGRSSSLLAAEAIAEYLRVNDWQVAGSRAAMASADRGECVAHALVKEWVMSWDKEGEQPAPRS